MASLISIGTQAQFMRSLIAKFEKTMIRPPKGFRGDEAHYEREIMKAIAKNLEAQMTGGGE